MSSVKPVKKFSSDILSMMVGTNKEPMAKVISVEEKSSLFKLSAGSSIVSVEIQPGVAASIVVANKRLEDIGAAEPGHWLYFSWDSFLPVASFKRKPTQKQIEKALAPLSENSSGDTPSSGVAGCNKLPEDPYYDKRALA